MFLGFLESGKTKFIQETLEDPQMENGKRTLLLVCEEGETEYDPKKFAVKNVVTVTLEDKSELNMDNLEAITKKYSPYRIFVEYNGTWMLQDFFDAMPESWVINQMMTFADSTTFLNYNANMRQLCYDKIYLTQLVVFNRFRTEYDKQEFHKIVRAAARMTDIIYEYEDGTLEPDDIQDPLPFDFDAPVIEIEDKDFAWFYRDIGARTDEYEGRTVKFKGMVALSRRAPQGYIILGRHIMTCCEADIAYDGFAVKLGNILDVKANDWIEITAEIKIEKNPLYQGAGPVLTVISAAPAEPPEEIVATYY